MTTLADYVLLLVLHSSMDMHASSIAIASLNPVHPTQLAFNERTATVLNRHAHTGCAVIQLAMMH